MDNIENFIFKIYKGYEHYEAWDSKYVDRLIDLLKSKRTDILFRILSRAKAEGIELNNSVFHECFKPLITEQNVEQFVKEIETFNEGRWFALNIFLSYSTDSELYKKGISYLPKEYEEYERRRAESQKRYPSADAKEINIYEKFKNKLGSKEKWYTDVFEFYVHNAEQLSLLPEDIEQLKERVFIVLKWDPLEGQVTFTNKQGAETSYTMTLNMSLFKECLAIAKKLGWDLSNVQQNILNCIPCAYNQELELIFECINDVTILDIKPILDVYIARTDDLAILRPESFMRACEKYRILLAIPILEVFVNNENLLVQDRRLAIEIMTNLNPNPEKLKGYFEKYCGTTTSKQLAEKANELLIGLNDKDAIEWRIAEIKNRAVKVASHEYGGKARAISEEESELHHKDFAKPLLNISDQRFFDHFIDLLKYSFNKVKEHNEYWEYANYVWDIVCEYIYNLRTNRKYDPLLRLEKCIYEEGINWFKHRIQKLKREYSSYIRKPDDILTCIHKYNKIVTNFYLFLKNDQDLINFIKTIIDEDLRRFVEDEGYYREIEKASGHKISKEVEKYLRNNGYDWLIQKAKGHQEDLIQKTLKVQLENIFLKNGLRDSDITREPQLQDDKRIDFKISYGFLGPVLIETKTTSNKEIRIKKERDDYKPKLKQYVDGFNAVFIYFLIFQVSSKYSISAYKPKLLELYEDCAKVGILDLNCIKVQ